MIDKRERAHGNFLVEPGGKLMSEAEDDGDRAGGQGRGRAEQGQGRGDQRVNACKEPKLGGEAQRKTGRV